MGKDEEMVELHNIVKCEGLIEDWLSNLEK